MSAPADARGAAKTCDAAAELADAVRAAVDARKPLLIEAGGTKRFYGRVANGERLDVGIHRGIVSYEPTELVITARAGTPLTDIEAALAEHDQMIGFEPPHFGPGATLGGTIACGLSGPRRPYAGSARDFVLGCKIINGRGEILSFGGQVMKNVAGYDVSRLMVGALGTLGVLLEVSLKVLPRPSQEITRAFHVPLAKAIADVNAWAGTPLPLSAACYTDETLYVRLSGSESAVTASAMRLGGDPMVANDFWQNLREQRLPFFANSLPLWRLSVPAALAPIDLPGTWLIDWGGAQRWLKTPASAQTIRAPAASAGGHAALFRGGDRGSEVFHPLSTPLRELHKRLKSAFDPAGIFNVGRFDPSW